MVVFVGGVHGSGKTTICQELARRTGYSHLSISEIIKKEKKTVFESAKRTQDIDANQKVLINWLKDNPFMKNIIFDGHFALLDNDSKIVCVSDQVFKCICANAFVFINPPVEVVRDRLRNRDGVIWSPTILKKLGEAELNWANKLSESFNIPIYVSNGADNDAIERFLKVHGVI